MRALVVTALASLAENPEPLSLVDRPVPVPGADEVLIRVSACGVCRTELDEIEGRTPPSSLPRVPGHQIVGRVVQAASDRRRHPASDRSRKGPTRSRRASALRSGPREGDRVGVAWIRSACGRCEFCVTDRENLCASFEATGRDADGGYAEYTTAPVAFTYAIPDRFADAEAAPLLCAGAVGYRALRLAGLSDGRPLGLTGFGASAHLVLALARHRYPQSPVFVFARHESERAFARERGAAWAGDSADAPPEPLAAVIDTTPAWTPVVRALGHLAPGGRLVVNAIRKEPGDRAVLADLDYAAHLWREKTVTTVANVTRRDVREFLDLASAIPIRPEIQTYDLAEANRALGDLSAGRIRGAKVLTVAP